MANRAPKQRELRKEETVSEFEAWRANLLYILSQDAAFARFVDAEWTRTRTDPVTRGLQDDLQGAANHMSGAQKKHVVEQMLGMVANYCPIYSRNSIIKNSTSLSSVWQMLRVHYHFQTTGGQFLDFDNIKREPSERPEDLYQRLTAFIEDSLVTVEGGLLHHGEPLNVDEDLSPTLENMVVLRWLALIHPSLPNRVKQRYCTELRAQTLASLKPEISLALDSLLQEIDDVTTQALRFQRESRDRGAFTRGGRGGPTSSGGGRRGGQIQPSCPICVAGGHASTHRLSACPRLPEADRRFMLRARQLDIEDEQNLQQYELDDEQMDHTVAAISATDRPTQPLVRIGRIEVESCPYIDVFSGGKAARVTLDTGCTGNVIRESVARRLELKMLPSKQRAFQADGITPLNVLGEVQASFVRDDNRLQFNGLVVKDLDVDILGGNPFQSVNDCYARPANREVYVGGSRYSYDKDRRNFTPSTAVRACGIIRSPGTASVYPGEAIALEIPASVARDSEEVAIESEKFGCQVTDVINDTVCLVNRGQDVLNVRRHEHVARVRPVYTPPADGPEHGINCSPQPAAHSTLSPGPPFSTAIITNPDGVISAADADAFRELALEFDEVFGPINGGYNGAFGRVEAVVNFGENPPPQRRGRLPFYPKAGLDELQDHWDELERRGFVSKPQEIGVEVELVHPSFLVKKPSGGNRLVSVFIELARFCRPTPSLMPDVEATLRRIAMWSRIIKADFLCSYYQVRLAHKSKKYVGFVTPYKGVRVANVAWMGLPGSECALEELMCRVFGQCVMEGWMARIADDIYVGAETTDVLLARWRRVLELASQANLRLSGKKTVICPASTVILGWQWEQGTLRATSHRLSALSTCTRPDTVKGLRSFIGAMKALSKVLQHSSQVLAPLDDMVAGKDSKQRLVWDDALTDTFSAAQASLNHARQITLPRQGESVIIVSDGALRYPGVGATLLVMRDGKPYLSGFFSAKLQLHQRDWLPCEVEALAIASAVKHFGPYIVQSGVECTVLTDSDPCVKAAQKLARGEFSASPRVTTMLATISRHRVTVQHLPGYKNLVADFQSRHVPACDAPPGKCQVCAFVAHLEAATVMSIGHLSAADIIRDGAKVPYASRAAWIDLQSACRDISRAKEYLRNGTRPSKKLTKIRDVKRYLQKCILARDGLLVVKREIHLVGPRELIVVPREVLPGLCMALHIKLRHPTAHQLKQVMQRQFFALDLDEAVQEPSAHCHECVSFVRLPKSLVEQSTTPPPPSALRLFSADILRRDQLYILVVRESVTSYTWAKLVTDEGATSIRDALIELCAGMVPSTGPPAIIKADCASAFRSLSPNDAQLLAYNIVIELGREKNPNKNPIADKAIQELEHELLREPLHERLSQAKLAGVIARLNARCRRRGLSAHEMLFARDQQTAERLPVDDETLIQEQHETRSANHESSARAKAPGADQRAEPLVHVGDIVYLTYDGGKHEVRPRYVIASIEGQWCQVKKFAGTQLRNRSYRVKKSECIVVRHEPTRRTAPGEDSESDSEAPSTGQLREREDVPSKEQPREREQVVEQEREPQRNKQDHGGGDPEQLYEQEHGEEGPHEEQLYEQEHGEEEPHEEQLYEQEQVEEQLHEQHHRGEDQPQVDSVRRSGRIRRLPRKLLDYELT